jgi:hypothetical protein
MAKIMATNQDFMELALEAGIMPKLKKTLKGLGVNHE